MIHLVRNKLLFFSINELFYFKIVFSPCIIRQCISQALGKRTFPATTTYKFFNRYLYTEQNILNLRYGLGYILR